MVYSPFRAPTVKSILDAVPHGYVLFVFNAKISTWRLAATRYGFSCHMIDAYSGNTNTVRDLYLYRR